MHNKRIGRDDVLKIEVSSLTLFYLTLYTETIHFSGLVLRPPLHGVLTPVAIAAVIAPHPGVCDLPPHVEAGRIILLERMIVATVIMIVVIAIVLGVQMIGTVSANGIATLGMTVIGAMRIVRTVPMAMTGKVSSNVPLQSSRTAF